ncbi:MAG TPA: hypothetical protein VGK67_10085 [Myxococcales bacterium]
MDVTLADAHDCTSACPTSTPAAFKVDISITRPLDAKGTAGSNVTEDLKDVIGTDPGPRTGTYE